MRRSFAELLRCPLCKDEFEVDAWSAVDGDVLEGALRSACGRVFPIIAGVPRILPPESAATLAASHSEFFRRHPQMLPPRSIGTDELSLRTLRAFGDEWRRFSDLHAAHEPIFRWYFEGADRIAWEGLRVLDAGCGMGRWLHFAAREGARGVGLDASAAVDVAAEREGGKADFVQADLRWPPFAPGSFDLVYSFGVVHHLDDPGAAVRDLAALVRPGGDLRLYVYRNLDGEPLARRALFSIVSAIRRVTTRLPYGALHAFSLAVAAVATGMFLVPRRILKGTPFGDRLTRGLPLVQYDDVPFRMLVAEQFDRFAAPLESRFRREEVEAWLRGAGLEVVAILEGLGWRAIARRAQSAGAVS